MEQRRKRRLYEVTAVFLGFSLVISVTTAVYTHLWLTATTTDLPTVFTDTLTEEKTVMQELRTVGAGASVVLVTLGFVLSRRYVQFIGSPRWEAKKTLTAGLFLNLTGILFYLVASVLFVRALYLSLVLLTGFVVVTLGVALLLTEDSDEDQESVDDSPHCRQCGTDVAETHPYCPRCGTELQ
jgi:hypothetical protein